MRITLAQARPTIARVLHLCEDSASVVDYINRACERLLYRGKWVDSYARYRVCVNSACLTWPRELETIEAAAISDMPMTIRNSWYEFLGSGPGTLAVDSDIGVQLVDRGNSITFDEITGDDKKVAVYCDGTETSGATILLQYYNAVGSKVFTLEGTTTYEGEKVSLPPAGNYTYTAKTVGTGGLYGVVKPVTNNMVRLYEYDTTTGALRPMAFYEPQETVPSYRSSLVPGIDPGDCTLGLTLIVMGKKRYIPVSAETDLLMIPHLDAVRLGCQAVLNEEGGLTQEALVFWGLANQALNEQSKHWQGSGAEQPMKMPSRRIYGAGVGNLI